MKDKVLQNIFEGTLFAVVMRSVIVGPNLSDALVIVGLLAAMSFKSHLSKSKLQDKDEVMSKISEMDDKIGMLTLKSGMTSEGFNGKKR